MSAVLPVVLTLSAMMLATSAAWLETSIANIRRAANMQDYLQAFHAADGALVLCTRALRSGAAPIVPAVDGEPVEWQRAGALEGPFAFEASQQWPGSVRAPQCLIEAWNLAGHPSAQAFLLTARGFGASQTSQAWLQFQIVVEEGSMTQTRWRRVVARPS
jgi:hypothetical protein